MGIIIDPRSRHYMTRTLVPAATILWRFTWVHDFFSERLPRHVEGWRARLGPNESLFLPGHMAHHVQNSCSQTLAVCRRPWRASLARDIYWTYLKTGGYVFEQRE